MHEALVVFHRWLGLIVALFIFVVAGTGGALVFENNIDRAMNRNLWYVARGDHAASLDTVAQSASRAIGGAAVAALTLPPSADRAIMVSVGGRQVFVDPYTGQVLGARELAAFNNSLSRRLHRLHVNFLMRDGGGTVVALTTIAALLLTITGIIVWWREKRWQILWSASWKRVVYDLHHSLGIIASAVLLVVAASGLAIHYNGLSKLIGKLDGVAAPTAHAQSPSSGAPQISLDSVARVAARALPEARVSLIVLPQKVDQPVRITMQFEEDRTPAGRSRIAIDKYTGAVLSLESTRAARTGTRVNNAMRAVHTGDLFGAPTRAIWFVAALVMATQSITGFVMWWNQRKARAAAARRGTVPATA